MNSFLPWNPVKAPAPVQTILHTVCCNILATIPLQNCYIFLIESGPPTPFLTLGIFPTSSPSPRKLDALRTPSAFRPIALMRCVCKVMERMVKRRLIFYLDAKGVLGDQQSGFRKYRGTMDHLTHLEHCISEAFAKKEFMIGVFLDIHKALNMTWRHGILMKLYAHGFRGNLPIFVYNFLQDGTFCRASQ